MRAAANSATPINSLTRRETVDPATLDLHDDRYDERPPPRPLPEKAPELDADFFFDEALVSPFFNTGTLNDLGDEASALAEQFGARSVLHQSAADDVGIPFDLAGLLIDGDHRHQQAILRQMAAISKHL